MYINQPIIPCSMHFGWHLHSWDKTTIRCRNLCVEVVGSPTHTNLSILFHIYPLATVQSLHDTETWQLNIWISTIYWCFPLFPIRKPPFQADLPGAIARWAAFLFLLLAASGPTTEGWVNKGRRRPSGFSTYGKSPCLIGKVILNWLN